MHSTAIRTVVLTLNGAKQLVLTTVAVHRAEVPVWILGVGGGPEGGEAAVFSITEDRSRPKDGLRLATGWVIPTGPVAKGLLVHRPLAVPVACVKAMREPPRPPPT